MHLPAMSNARSKSTGSSVDVNEGKACPYRRRYIHLGTALASSFLTVDTTSHSMHAFGVNRGSRRNEVMSSSKPLQRYPARLVAELRFVVARRHMGGTIGSLRTPTRG